MRASRVVSRWAALVLVAVVAVPTLSAGGHRTRLRLTAATTYSFGHDSSSPVSCVFSAGSISSIKVPAPEVKAESRWGGLYKAQYVRWIAQVQAHEGGRWRTVATEKRWAKAGFQSWTRFRAISHFARSQLAGAGHAAYRVVETLLWYDPQVKGKIDTRVKETLHRYHYAYHTSSRSDCQNRRPVAYGQSTTTYPGQGNAVQVTGHDPDGDSPLTLRILSATMNDVRITGFAQPGGSHTIELFPTTAEVGNTVDVRYELVDPAGAASHPATVAVSVQSSSGSGETPSPSPSPTTTGPSQMTAPAASDHNVSTGAGYNGAVQVTFTDPSPGSGSLSEIDYALNGTTTSGSWTPAGAGQSEARTISGLTNGATYTVALRACNTANICGAWSTPSNQVSPYTVPNKPSVSASANGLTITFSWSGGGGGGRSLGHYLVCVDSVGCSNYPAAGSVGHAYSSYSTTYSETVTYIDSAGQSSASAVTSAQTGSAPQPPTWLEYTGSAANTWTNYTNAGGTEGPQIAKNAGVYISCRLTGFKVADGNTWWYRIASSPWNNAYYVSADAFYNNGATSGSLSGTPWVDTNVATC